MSADQHHEDTLSHYEPVEPASLEETTELIEYFKKQVDREALRENLKLTPSQRVEKMQRFLQEQHRNGGGPDNTDRAALAPLQEPATIYSTTHMDEDRPADATNDLVEAFKRDVDRTLLIENLKLTPAQRLENFLGFMEMIYEVREAGRRSRERNESHVPRKN